MIKEMVYWLWNNFKTHINNASAHHTNHQIAAAEDAAFKSVNIIAGEAYKQNGVNILRAKITGNIFIGENMGALVTGNNNVFIGNWAGHSNTSGECNTFIAPYTGYSNTSGRYNTFIGHFAGVLNTVGTENVFISRFAGYNNINGQKNVFIGFSSGYSNQAGGQNVCIGYQAGYYNLASNMLFIAGGATNALTLMHGEFDNKRLFFKGAATAPADAKLHNSDINFWLDETNDRLQIKVKKSDGTVLTGWIQLA